MNLVTTNVWVPRTISGFVTAQTDASDSEVLKAHGA